MHRQADTVTHVRAHANTHTHKYSDIITAEEICFINRMKIELRVELSEDQGMSPFGVCCSEERERPSNLPLGKISASTRPPDVCLL